MSKIKRGTTSIPTAIVNNNSAADLVAGEYEVFLSFCGKDTRHGFTDFLYTYLVGAGIRTFRDDNELRVGEEIGPELLKAIKDSKISIPIFSKNYASSKWCLRELAHMVECQTNGGQLIFPIFYDVDPSYVQHQRGSYEKAFRQHTKSLDKKTVQQWGEALTVVGELKGLELKKETNRREGELVKIIVEQVLLKLKKNYKHVPKNLVGIDHHTEKFQIDVLAGNHNWYEAQSRIIITARNEEVLDALEVTCQKEGLLEVCTSYKPGFMDDDLSLQLFSRHAFMRDSPPDDYDLLAKEVVSTAGGLPLVLVTLGSLLLVEKDKGSWQEKLKKLKAIPHKKVLEKLRLSYEPLDNKQKQIFLDIACLFSGVDKISSCYMWDDCEFYPLEGINTLVRRSLITIGDDNKLWMHDQLRELGKLVFCEENVNESGERSRLWRHEDALVILKTHMGTKKVKALCLDLDECKDLESPFPRLVGQDFAELTNLRYLRMCNADLDV